jgi:hypothetical protein
MHGHKAVINSIITSILFCEYAAYYFLFWLQKFVVLNFLNNIFHKCVKRLALPLVLEDQ